MRITQTTKDHIFTHLANLELVQKRVKKSEKTIKKQTVRVTVSVERTLDRNKPDHKQGLL